jgi:hypothetical protein
MIPEYSKDYAVGAVLRATQTLTPNGKIELTEGNTYEVVGESRFPHEPFGPIATGPYVYVVNDQGFVAAYWEKDFELVGMAVDYMAITRDICG